MADHAPNFSCSDPNLSREFVTDRIWQVQATSIAHEQSITAIAAIQILYVLIGVPWNATVLIVTIGKQLYKEPTYMFLFNMVLADLLVLVIMPFNIASSFPMKFLLGGSDWARCQVCHTIIIATLILTNVSVFSLALLSVDRLIYIRWPFMYDKIVTTKSVILTLIVTWIFCIVITLPPLFGFGEIKFANPFGSCSIIATGETRLASNITYVAVLLVAISIPLTANFVVDIWLLIIVCSGLKERYTKTRNSIRSTTNRNPPQKKDSEAKLKGGYQKQKLYIIEVFGIIFAVNIVTIIPTSIITVLSLIIGAERISIWSFAFVHLIYLCQPTIHPILETCLVGKARKVLFKVLCYLCTRRQRRTHLMTKTSNLQLGSLAEA